MNKETKFGVATYDGDFPWNMDNVFDTEKEALDWAKAQAETLEQEFIIIKMTSTHTVEPSQPIPPTVTKLK